MITENGNLIHSQKNPSWIFSLGLFATSVWRCGDFIISKDSVLPSLRLVNRLFSRLVRRVRAVGRSFGVVG